MAPQTDNKKTCWLLKASIQRYSHSQSNQVLSGPTNFSNIQPHCGSTELLTPNPNAVSPTLLTSFLIQSTTNVHLICIYLTSFSPRTYIHTYVGLMFGYSLLYSWPCKTTMVFTYFARSVFHQQNYTMTLNDSSPNSEWYLSPLRP